MAEAGGEMLVRREVARRSGGALGKAPEHGDQVLGPVTIAGSPVQHPYQRLIVLLKELCQISRHVPLRSWTNGPRFRVPRDSGNCHTNEVCLILVHHISDEGPTATEILPEGPP